MKTVVRFFREDWVIGSKCPTVALLLLLCALVGAAASAAGCGGAGPGASPTPLASLAPTLRSSPAPTWGRAWAGVIGTTDIGFRGGPRQDVTLRVVAAHWRESVLAADGSVHEKVLAVGVRVTSGEKVAGWLRLGKSFELTLSNGVALQSGGFPVAGALRAIRPGEQRQGWIVFDHVDWDALRGNAQPDESRLRVDLFAGDGQWATGEWSVGAGDLKTGPLRQVGISVLNASVGYNTL